MKVSPERPKSSSDGLIIFSDMVEPSELCRWIRTPNKFSAKSCNSLQDNERTENLGGEEARDMEDINVFNEGYL